jgi:ribosomal protein L21
MYFWWFDGEAVKIGQPVVDGAKVMAKIVEQVRL